MKIRFYNRDGLWYADLPKYIEQGGSEEDCLMIEGADTFLDKLSEYKLDEIFLEIDVKRMENFDGKILYLGDIEGYNEGDYIEITTHHYMWLCGITVWLFGNYPQVIYYKKL